MSPAAPCLAVAFLRLATLLATLALATVAIAPSGCAGPGFHRHAVPDRGTVPAPATPNTAPPIHSPPAEPTRSATLHNTTADHVFHQVVGCCGSTKAGPIRRLEPGSSFTLDYDPGDELLLFFSSEHPAQARRYKLDSYLAGLVSTAQGLNGTRAGPIGSIANPTILEKGVGVSRVSKQ
ncbi:MAG TPA: hypothetical protein VD963_01770 [Phycisphaerales bacterium]|nr:hypothetical protein [Phycisphaerales bacterium]